MTDYGPAPAKPKVFYARRDVCTACHQNEAAIFSACNWEETTTAVDCNGIEADTAGLVELVRRELKGAATYHGVPITRDSAKLTRPLPVVNDVSFIADNASKSSDHLSIVRLWQYGCASTKGNARECRARLLELILTHTNDSKLDQPSFDDIPDFPLFLADDSTWTLSGTPQFNRLQSLLEPIWTAGGSAFFNATNALISEYSPLNLIGKPTNKTNWNSEQEINQVKTSLANTPLPSARDPLLPQRPGMMDPRKHQTTASWLNMVPHNALRSGVFNKSDITAIRKAAQNSPKILNTTIDRLLSKTTDDQPGIYGPNLNRKTIMTTLLTELGAPPAAPEFNFQSMPPPLVLPKEGTVPKMTTSEGQALVKYCADCHAGDHIDLFTGANELEVFAKLKANAKDVINTLDWETEAGSVMPPLTSPLYKELQAQPELRRKMLEKLKTFVSTPASDTETSGP